ncbi:phosphate-selective porin O and P [Desulfurobacterium thermolithotrophum DSM 11699]|uniref:Phosphate-selective porin O and P n=1 Tax=Desulfurobacterium thermolithotrophum (strain DSM 11699 / BSA) TaxID=868864 RepID=F0S2S7_DESTD|nr:phosphate porin [Desulfurobacterium thermolithotrophum]ADY73149.1 phosphate-selective porin O and P [Desulfurobacterium thermolithotrophum DSM 11699]
MRKFLAVSTVFMLSLGSVAAFGQEVSNDEVLEKLQQLEQKVAELEKENESLRSLVRKSGYTVMPRKRTEKLQVDGRILLRWDQTNFDYEGGNNKNIYGEKANGLVARKVRFRFHGNLNDNIGYMIHVRADRGETVELWDAFIDYKFDAVPLKLRMGQQKIPVSMSYLKPGPKIIFPERPIAVRKMGSHNRDLGIRAIFSPMKKLKLEAAVMDGEGFSTLRNDDKKYSYILAVDSTPINSSDFKWRIRAAYEGGYGWAAYNDKKVAKRNLFDLETKLDIKPVNLALEAGYLHDNPNKSTVTKYALKGNVAGYYLQADYAVPGLQKLHLIGRYSEFDKDTDVSNNEEKYASAGFYYLLNGWQAAIRGAYVHVIDTASNQKDLISAEFQLLF